MAHNKKKDAINDTTYRIGWKNFLISSVIILAVSGLVRLGMWYLMVWMGSADVFSDDFCNASLGTLLVFVVTPLAFNLWSYCNYRRLGMDDPLKMPRIASGEYGHPWQQPFTLMIVAEVVLAIISLILIYISFEMSMDSQDDRTVMGTYAMLHGINLVADILLFQASRKWFKPDEIQARVVVSSGKGD